MILWATHLRSLASVHFELSPGFYQIGRSTDDDGEDKLAVPFDRKLSRRTARIEVKPSKITVKRDGSKAPLFVEGLEKDVFDLLPGQRFGVAETVFELAHEMGQTMTVDEVNDARPGQSEQVLSLMLELQPLFQTDASLEELGTRLNQVLAPSHIAIFKADPLTEFGQTELVPSKSLVAQACEEGEPVYFEWTSADGGAQPTAAQGESWALAAPIFAGDEKLLLYAVGHRSIRSLERGGLCILAQMLKSHLDARQLGDLAQAKAAIEQLKADVDPKVRRATERAIRGGHEMASLRIFSLGEFEANFEGERLDKQWGGRQSAWLLTYLAAAGRTVTEDRLLADFWPDKGSGAKKTLAVAMSRLRKNLQQFTEADPVAKNAGGYQLDPALHFWHDYGELNELLSLAEPSKVPELTSEQILETGNRLLQLNRGPFLDGCYLDWAVERRNELDVRLRDTLVRLADAASGHEKWEEAHKFAQASLKLDPCLQEAHLLAMNALVSLGRPEQALRQYELCERTLQQELNVEPSIEMLKAYQMAKLLL